jgi:hypothetical protein
MTTFANSKQATGDSLTRVGALAGAAGPLLFTAAFVLQNALRSDDDARPYATATVSSSPRLLRPSATSTRTSTG